MGYCLPAILLGYLAMIEFRCECGRRMVAKEEFAGRQTRCIDCKRVLTIPRPKGTIAAQTAASQSLSKGGSLTAMAAKALEADRAAALAGEKRTARDYMYLLFLLAMIPLAIYTFHGQTHSPPLLAAGSSQHWLFAFLSASLFLGMIIALFPRGGAKWKQLLAVGAFTSTGGILLLFVIQTLAFATAGWIITGGGIIGLIFLLFKLVLGGYLAAFDPRTNYFISSFGFTVSVGFLEEGIKILPVVWHIKTRGTLGWRGACIWGLASGAAFGVAEGINFSSTFYNGHAPLEMYIVRFVSCVALHAVWTGSAAIFAYQQRKQIDEISHPLGYINAIVGVTVLSILLHGQYDTLLKKHYSGAALFVALVSVLILALQIEFMRKRELNTTMARSLNLARA